VKKLILAACFISNPGWTYEVNDSHFHLTNYIQEGTDIKKMLAIMGDKVGRAVLFGIPLQQQWSERISGEKNPPKYYLDTDAHLYYYSFTDAYVAMAFNSLTPDEKKRFDPMITGFNPTDMYAVDHIKRVLKTFPGVFSGIGEFTIHKEFVSSKIAGDVASLTDKALDRILDFTAESGLIAIIHNDFHTPFPKEGAEPTYFQQMKDLLRRHSDTDIIWAHFGVGRIIQPLEEHGGGIERILKDPAFKNVYFDISWSEVAKYVVASSKSLEHAAALIEKYPDRFLYGSDEVAPNSSEQILKVYKQYEPLWALLKKETLKKVTIRNHERLFDKARRKVRAWEKKNL